MIGKGQDWGAPVVLRGDEPVAASDAELAALVLAGVPGPIRLTGGDLHHSLGGTPSAAVDHALALPIDLVEVTAGGAVFVAVAHVVARRRWWVGEAKVAMNGTHLGEWNLGPKAHPNDGLVDVTTGRLGLRDRLAAAKRAVTGTHVPHPALRVGRVPRTVWQFERPTPLYVDGVVVGSFTEVSISVSPDRGEVVVG